MARRAPAGHGRGRVVGAAAGDKPARSRLRDRRNHRALLVVAGLALGALFAGARAPPPALSMAVSRVFRASERDALVLGAALVQAALLAAALALAATAVPGPGARVALAVGLALAMNWGSNTVSHIHLHAPLFRGEAANGAFSLFLSVLLAVPQSWWKLRHLAHHELPDARDEPPGPGAARARRRRARRAARRRRGARRGRAARLRDRLRARDAARLRALREPGAAGAPAQRRRRRRARAALQPAVVQRRLPRRPPPRARGPLDDPAGARRRRATSSAPCRRSSAGSNSSPRSPTAPPPRRSTRSSARRWGSPSSAATCSPRTRAPGRALLRDAPDIREVTIIGGGLFPRTALVLARLLPDARLTIVDAVPAHLEHARAFLAPAHARSSRRRRLRRRPLRSRRSAQGRSRRRAARLPWRSPPLLRQPPRPARRRPRLALAPPRRRQLPDLVATPEAPESRDPPGREGSRSKPVRQGASRFGPRAWRAPEESSECSVSRRAISAPPRAARDVRSCWPLAQRPEARGPFPLSPECGAPRPAPAVSSVPRGRGAGASRPWRARR